MDELQHVLVGKRVEYVPALPPAGDEAFGTQQPEAVRHRGHRFVRRLGELRNTSLAVHEHLERPQAGFVAEGLEQANRSGEGVGRMSR